MIDKHRKMASGSEKTVGLHGGPAPKSNGADPIGYVEHLLGIAFGPGVCSPSTLPKGCYRVEK